MNQFKNILLIIIINVSCFYFFTTFNIPYLQFALIGSFYLLVNQKTLYALLTSIITYLITIIITKENLNMYEFIIFVTPIIIGSIILNKIKFNLKSIYFIGLISGLLISVFTSVNLLTNQPNLVSYFTNSDFGFLRLNFIIDSLYYSFDSIFSLLIIAFILSNTGDNNA